MNFLIQKIKYYFDTALERKFLNLIFLLIFISSLIIFVFSIMILVAYKLGASVQLGETYSEFLWRSFVLFLNPGVLANSEGSNVIDFLFKFTITIFGIIVFSTLVGIVTQGFAMHLERLRAGQSQVLEKNHIVICGYTKKTIPLIRQLSLAYENKKLVILIVTIHEPKFIQEKIKDLFPSTIKVISRQGYIWQEKMINRCNIQQCQGIFLLNPDNDHYYKTQQDSDIEVTKSFLSLVQSPEWQKNPIKIILEVFDNHTANSFIDSQHDILKKISSKKNFHYPLVVSSSNLKEKLIGLSISTPDVVAIFESLFGFQGSEFYFIDHENDQLAKTLDLLQGKKISTLNKLLQQSIIVGVYPTLLMSEKTQSNNAFHLNPHIDYPFKKYFGLIVLSKSHKAMTTDFKNLTSRMNDSTLEVRPIPLCEPANIPRNIAIVATSNDQSDKIRKIIKATYQFLNFNKKIKSWYIVGDDETVSRINDEAPEPKEHRYFDNNSMPLGLKLFPVKIHPDKIKIAESANSIYSFQVVEILNQNLLNTMQSNISIGDYLLHFDIPRQQNEIHQQLLNNKNKNTLRITWEEFINSDIKYSQITSSDFTYRKSIFIDDLNESKKKIGFIYYQTQEQGDVTIEKLNFGDQSNNELIEEFNQILSKAYQEQKKSLKDMICFADPYKDYFLRAREEALTEKPYLLDQDHIIILSDEIDEGHYSNPVEDHDMIYIYNFFYNLFDKPNKIVREIEANSKTLPSYVNDSERGRHKENLLDQLTLENSESEFVSEQAPSYISELNSYKTKAILDKNRRQNFSPFEGVDFLEVNSLTSKMLASNFYDNKNSQLVDYLFHKKNNYFKSYVIDGSMPICTYAEIRNFFIERGEIILGFMDYEFSSYFGGGRRKLKLFNVNPPAQQKISLNKGDKIVVLANYHNAFQQGDGFQDNYSFL